MAFKKGQTGNPGGRPKTAAKFHTALNMEIKALEGKDDRGLRGIAKKLIEMAEEGDMQAIKEIADRLDGKPHQSVSSDVDLKGDFSDFLQAIDGVTRGIPKSS